MQIWENSQLVNWGLHMHLGTIEMRLMLFGLFAYMHLCLSCTLSVSYCAFGDGLVPFLSPPWSRTAALLEVGRQWPAGWLPNHWSRGYAMTALISHPEFYFQTYRRKWNNLWLCPQTYTALLLNYIELKGYQSRSVWVLKRSIKRPRSGSYNLRNTAPWWGPLCEPCRCWVVMTVVLIKLLLFICF